MDDDEFNRKKKSLYNDKYKSRRWSNCFGLAKKFKRLKNRLSTIQANDIPHHQLSTRRNSNVTLKHDYSLHQHKSQHHHYSTSTIASCSVQESSTESNEQLNSLAPLATYHSSSVNTPNQSLSPPPRHGHAGRGRAFSDTSGYCYNDWRQFTDSYQKMNQRLSLDTESIHQQHRKRRQDCNTATNVTSSSIISDCPVASVRDSMIIYQEDDASTLRTHSNASTISNSSSLTPQAPPAQPAFLAPYRSGTLGYPKSTQKIRANAAPPLPPLSLLVQRQQQQQQQQQQQTPLAFSSSATSSSGRLSIDSASRSSTLSSIDIPLKERRRRRSPLMFSDNDKLTLPIPRHDIITIQQNIHNNDSKRIDGSTMKEGLHDRDTTKLKLREKAMQQLEGASSSSSSDRKVVSMTRIASPKFLDEQLVAAAAAATTVTTGTGDPTLLMNKAHYDAVVSRTIQQQRRPSSSVISSPVTATQTVSLLSTPSAGKVVFAAASSSSSYSYSKYGTPTTTTISPFLPTPSSSSSHQYPSPSPPPPLSSSVYFPSTPNSLDSYL